MFQSVLIANRGEIALRIARTCREMGLRVLLAHSTADRDGAAKQLADRTIQIGPAPARQSYLSIPAVVEAALACGAQAVHPGYGLLSEDGDFAEVCEANGLVFVGPPAAVIRRLGDKIAARAAMAAAGVPVLEGGHEPARSVADAQRVAESTGYPLVVKAAAGGGGRGQGIVHDPVDLPEAFTRTRATALALFGDPTVYVERYLPSARHVEIQILCDRYGNGVSLGERDCSVQRRQQKLVEETPAPRLARETVARMSAAAVDGALAAGYVGVGTVEFLVDTDNRFYFLEVNCRIQVEHPVTEMVTGLDLVREQFLVAAGERLRLRQADVAPRGAAIECRVNAEDPDRDFAPTPGVLTEFVLPDGPFVRIDTHAHHGYRIPPDYDSLLAKVIVWAPDRAQALSRMRRALDELRISGPGVSTSAPFLRDLLDDPRFDTGAYDTTLVASRAAARTATTTMKES